MPSEALNSVYADQLRNHPEGHAVYFRVSGSQMKPGACGYFNQSGQWRTIVETAEAEPRLLTAQGWRAPSNVLNVDRSGGIEWPIKLSESVNEVNVTAAVTANIPGVPISGGFNMSFGTKRGAGAILITGGEVKSYQLVRDMLALQWILDVHNMQKILEDWPEISKEKRTLWMVTSTYLVQSCALSVLNSPESSVTIGMDVNVVNVAQASPSVQWWNQHTDKTWNKYTADDDSGIVVFMSGIAFSVGRLRRSQLFAEQKKSKQHLHRAAPTTSLQYSIEDEEMPDDPWIVQIVPKYEGKASQELETALEDLIALDGEDDDEDGGSGDSQDDDR
ncbi:hypothetical protein LTS10_008561 [Elasticomyces elasticus]|nr:hypothetical protein LTS10_008561 [Elasticomyces elasticus]